MTYKKTIWKNDAAPYLEADNLNNIESGIEEAHAKADTNTAVIQKLEETKANKSDIPVIPPIPENIVTDEKLNSTLADYVEKSELADYATEQDLSEAVSGLNTAVSAKADKLTTASKEDLENGLKTKADVSDVVSPATLEERLKDKADVTSIPSKLPAPEALTIILGGESFTYDGSSATTVVIENAETTSY